MPNLTTSADIDAFLAAANDAAARTELGLTTLATTTPGTGVVTALGTNIGTAGSFVVFNGAGGTPSSLTGTNITGTAAGLTAGTASAVAVGGITGLGTNVATALAVNVGSAGAFLTFNGAGGTPSSLTGTNITGTAAGLTAGTASAVAVGGITGLGTGVGTFLATPTTANLLAAVTGETGTGAVMFGTSPSITTSLISASASLDVFNTVATTLNFAGATTALNIGAGAAQILNFGGFTSAAEMRFLEPSASGTNYSGFKQPALTTSITYLWPSDAPANGDVLTCQSNGTLSWETPSGSANAVTAASVAGSAGLFWTSGGADRTAVATDTVAAATITTATVGAMVAGSATMALFNTVATTINFGGAATTLNVGTSATVLNFGGGATAAEFRFLEPSGSGTNYTAFKAKAQSANITYTLPDTVGAAGTFLKDVAGDGVLSWASAAGSGTVTSVSFTGGLISVATATTTPALTVAGTSGGVPYFSSSSAWASSAALAANAIVVGGGAGAAPATITTGANVLTALGVAVGSAGAFITFNGAGGTPSSMVGTNITGLAPANIVAGTLGGTITLGEGTQQIALDPALSADGTYSGIIVTGTSGYAQTIGDLVYLDPTDSRWEACDANSASGADGDARGNIAMVVVAGTDGNSCTLLLRGRARFAGFPAGMTINNPLYVSETAGAITQTQPTTTDVVIRIIGHATTADEINFCPDNLWFTHT